MGVLTGSGLVLKYVHSLTEEEGKSIDQSCHVRLLSFQPSALPSLVFRVLSVDFSSHGYIVAAATPGITPGYHSNQERQCFSSGKDLWPRNVLDISFCISPVTTVEAREPGKTAVVFNLYYQRACWPAFVLT